MNKAVFLDRDGVINGKAPGDGYITRWEDFKILPGVAEAIRRLRDAGFLVIVVTNQRCVAKGLLSETGLREIHRKMVATLRRQRAAIDAVYYCPHEGEENCDCRKPRPGMILQAAQEHQIDLSSSWIVGDDCRDVETGKAAGCRTILLAGPPAAIHSAPQADFVVSSLNEAVENIVNQSPLFCNPAGREAG